ncbi:MAG: S41 family peptidase [Thomasclavelia sp.]|uniref:S41 family peptidase n=1 Tax=Thomasclavelia sp. TaxID=3025757 RepID=UPI00399F8127
MEDFIQPNQKIKKPIKKNHFKETIFIILMIICLGIGFVSGYVIKKTDSNFKNGNVDTTVLDEAYEILNNYWYNPNDNKVDIEGNSIAALVNSLGDIHSSYFTFEQSVAFNQSVDGNFDGIGVAYTALNNGIIITKVYQKSPASKSGLQVGDIVTNVDDTNIAGKNADEVKNLVRGDAGTNVKLTVTRGEKVFTVDVERGNVETAVNGEIKEENGKKFGYIGISTFGSTTGEEVEKFLELFVDEQVSNVVIDLRGNGGGYLVAANEVLNLFVDEGKTIYQIKEKNGAVQKTKASDGKKYSFANNYILVDDQTASASEVVAGTLQELCDFKLVGSQTYGKGTAQTQKQLSDGSVLKYTYARWLLPSGKWINEEGLTPDYLVENIDVSDISTKTVDKDLSYDCVDERVLAMQKSLKILGYDCKREDGYFSSDTVEALKQFESANNLTVDGIYNDNDKNMLISKVIIYINDPSNDYQYKKLIEIME